MRLIVIAPCDKSCSQTQGGPKISICFFEKQHKSKKIEIFHEILENILRYCHNEAAQHVPFSCSNTLRWYTGPKIAICFFLKKQQKLKKIQNFKKSFKISRGITIMKLHAKFHCGTTNSLGGRRNQKFPSVFLKKTAKIEEKSKFQKIL